MIGEEYIGAIQTALDAPVSSVMTSDVVAVEVEDDVSLIIELMLDRKIGAVPVVDSEDMLVGIVSYVDLLKQLLPEEPAQQERAHTPRSPRN
jgi:CBS domain-containing protein